MTILVTGGAGFIGTNFILDWLHGSDERVVNVDKLTYASNLNHLSELEDDPRYLFVHADVCDKACIARLLREHQVRAMVHFAAESHVDKSLTDPEAFIQTNIVGTFRLLEAVREYAPHCKEAFRFLHVSTDEVYGSLEAQAPAFKENHPYLPNSPYSASKAASDHLVRAYHQSYGLPVLTTNCSNNYGPFQFPEKLIPLCIQKARSGDPIPIYGNGLQVRDWLYVGDHCAALREVLARGTIGQTYNIGGHNEKTNLEVVQLICSLLDELQPSLEGHSYAQQITFVTDRPGHDTRYAIDASKIQKELNWTPKETFESALKKTLLWYLKSTPQNTAFPLAQGKEKNGHSDEHPSFG
jgi:dTDP-glucose 4,6-dehydratase